MQSLGDVVVEAIHEKAVSLINDGTDALGIPIYDDDGRDLSEDDKWVDNFLNRLYNYVHGSEPPERDWWAIEAGKAQMLLKLANILGVKIDPREKRLVEWLANLF